ncbi:MAG TPA: hypothetical protein VMY34_09950 [Acidimicrobiales bacterium]|nr:hypothetical protein [Acidimicrobiales bacterium]
MTEEHNPFREAKRKAKAEAMVRWLRHYQVTAEQAEQMDEAGWVALAALANVPAPSPTTKAMVIGCLSMAPMTGRF